MSDPAVIPCVTPRLQHRFLTPGELLVVTAPTEITTILGPCIAVTFWCTQSHVGAICHAMLPSESVGFASPGGKHPWKYVDAVIPEMRRRFLRKGGNAANMEVKLFGGADLLQHEDDPLATRIGPQNVELARELLVERGLPILAADVGGHKGRKLIFNTQTGAVRIKRLPNFTPLHA